VLPGRIVGSLGEIDVDPHNPDRVYAASHRGVWIFDGQHWTVRNDQHGLEKDAFGALNFSTIAVDPTRPNVIYAGQRHSWRGTARGISRSTDRGEHWENITRNLGPDLTVWAITVSPHDGTVWLGTDYGNWKLKE
jgi:ligand-binding sensor domain-containing protein